MFSLLDLFLYSDFLYQQIDDHRPVQSGTNSSHFKRTKVKQHIDCHLTSEKILS